MTKTDDTEQTAAHTSEPWRITGQSCRDYEGAEIGTGNKTVAVILTADAVEVSEEEHANASRLVAAVNACEGIRTEALEQGVVAELLSALTDFFNIMHDYESSVEKGYVQQAMERSRAAIEQATGRAA